MFRERLAPFQVGSVVECEDKQSSASHMLMSAQPYWVERQRLSMMLESYVEFHYCFEAIDNRKERALGS